MGISQSRVIGKKGSSIKRLSSNEQFTYYRVTSTKKIGTCRVVYADSQACEIYVEENTPISFVNLYFTSHNPGAGNSQISIILNGVFLAQEGFSKSPEILEPITGSATINGFNSLSYDRGGGSTNETQSRGLIVKIPTNKIISLPNFTGTDIKKL